MPSTASAVDLPFKDAIDFFRQKIDTPSAHWTTVMDEAHARAFAVAGATKTALIGDFRQAVDKAISQGTSYGEFKKDFDALVKKFGWSHTGTADWRARIIYNTNLSTAFAAGRYAQMTEPDVLAAFPYWQYQHVNCPNPRLQHLAWSGMVLRADDPFWATCYPPNGWNCHCIVYNLSQRALEKTGRSGPDKSPALQWREYVNRATGVVTKYPAGVDPGFVGNPGQAWLRNKPQDLKAPRVRPVSPAPPVLAPAGKTAVAPAVLQKFIAQPQGAVQVGVLDGHTAKILDAYSRRVLLSADTMAKQVLEHPELPADIYAGIDALVAAPEAVLSNRPYHVRLLGRIGDAAVTAVVKKTPAENFVVSLHRVRADSIKQFFKRAKLMAGDAQALLAWLEQTR